MKNGWEIVEVWETQVDEIKAYLTWFDGFDDRNYAAVQGAANFTPAMLPNLWSGHPCPYSTPLYKEAWYRGFYSAASWFLIERLAFFSAVKPDLRSMFAWYCENHTPAEWKRVPGGSGFTICN